MNEQIRSILVQETTKTSKIQQLVPFRGSPCGNCEDGNQRQLRFRGERPAPDEGNVRAV